jgi:hypothetical protein
VVIFISRSPFEKQAFPEEKACVLPQGEIFLKKAWDNEKSHTLTFSKELGRARGAFSKAPRRPRL